MTLTAMLKESRLNSIGSTATAEGWIGQNIRDSITRDSKEKERLEKNRESRYSSLTSVIYSGDSGEDQDDHIQERGDDEEDDERTA